MKKGSFTIRTAGVFFLLSAALELFSLTDPVPLLGEVRAGGTALVYHLFYVTLFLVIGFGLWAAKPWGEKAVYVGTVAYTVDQGLLLFDHQMVARELLAQLRDYGVDVLPLDLGMLLEVIALVVIACWWGFALYIYVRRDYFHASPPPAGTDA